MRRRGFTTVELLTGVVIMGVVLGGIFTAFSGMWNNQSQAIGMPAAQEGAKQMAVTLGEAFRAPVECHSTDSGCTVGAPIDTASSTSCNIYSRPGTSLVSSTYAVTNGNFQVTTGGVTTTYATGATLNLTYYSSTTYNTTALTTFTPTTATAANLLGVQIAVSVTQNGYTNSYTTFVRLRNGP